MAEHVDPDPRVERMRLAIDGALGTDPLHWQIARGLNDAGYRLVCRRDPLTDDGLRAVASLINEVLALPLSGDTVAASTVGAAIADLGDEGYRG